MSDETIIALIETTLDEKLKQDENLIRYSFYEVNVKFDDFLSKEYKSRFIYLLKNKFENMKYKVYLQGQIYEYNNEKKIVQDNEVIIAIKEK